jgi:hypothetical protein
MTMGGFLGVLLGQWLVWLTLRNPLRVAVRLCREAWRDILRVSASGADVVGRVNAAKLGR